MIEKEIASGKREGSRNIHSVQARPVNVVGPAKKRRKSGIPTGNAGEYFVMGELLRRGYDAQLADRNTKAYDLLVGHPEDKHLQKVQVKTVRMQPWYVRQSSFEGELLDQVTVYVLIGKEDADQQVRYFIACNRDVAAEVSVPSTWKDNDSAFMMLKSLAPFEGRWSALFKPSIAIPPTQELNHTPRS
jgi:hypothetical protein